MVHFSSLVLVLLLCVASCSYAAKVVEVGVICKEAKDPLFCSTLLNSKPGGATGADLVSLAQYTIDVCHANLTNTIKLIKTLIAQSGSDVKARAHYEKCLASFDPNWGALSALKDMQRLLKLGNYYDVNVCTNAITLDIMECTLGGPDVPPCDELSLLSKYADVDQQVVQIIHIISNYLMHN